MKENPKVLTYKAPILPGPKVHPLTKLYADPKFQREYVKELAADRKKYGIEKS